MITGLKVVQGASKMVSSKNQSYGVNTNAQVDLALIGAPGVAPGVDMGARHQDSRFIEWESAEPYVFAFRLREIFYCRETGPKSKAYNDGALYSEETRRNVKSDPVPNQGRHRCYVRMIGEGGVSLSDLELDNRADFKIVAANNDEDDDDEMCE